MLAEGEIFLNGDFEFFLRFWWTRGVMIGEKGNEW